MYINNYFPNLKKPPSVLIPDDRELRISKKKKIIKKKRLKNGCLVKYKNKIHRIKTITKEGLIYFEEARSPVNPGECDLA